MLSVHPLRWWAVPRVLLRPEAWLGLGIVIFTGLYLAAIGPYWNISPDSARYVEAARGLADGSFFEKLRFHPPGTSLVFGAVMFFFPNGYLALNAATTLLFLLSLWFAYVLLRRSIPLWQCLLIVLLSLAAIQLFYQSTRLLSEPVYMFASLLGLMLLERSDSEDRHRLREVAGGGMLVATALTRTIGITLVLAVLVVEGKALLTRRERARPLVLGLAGLALLAVVLWELRVAGEGFSGNFKMAFLDDPWIAESGYTSPAGLMARVLANRVHVMAIGALLTGTLSTGLRVLDVLIHAGATLAFLAGLLIALRRRMTITGLYVLLYVAVVLLHVLKGGYSPFRHFVPILPLLFYYAFGAVSGAARWITGRLGRKAAPLLAAAAVACVSVYVWSGFRAMVERVPLEHQSPFGSYPIKWSNNFDGQRLAMWLNDHSDPGEVYAAVHTNIYDLITQRTGRELAGPAGGSPEEFARWLLRYRIRFILLDRNDPVLRGNLLRQTAARPERFRLISELPHAGLYEVLPVVDRGTG